MLKEFLSRNFVEKDDNNLGNVDDDAKIKNGSETLPDDKDAAASWLLKNDKNLQNADDEKDDKEQ